MKTILDEILADVRVEVAAAKQAVPLSEIRARLADAPPTRDFTAALGRGGFGLIAEIKRRSPSVGPMREENVNYAAATYAASNHVRAVSILTNRTHFGMGIEDMSRIRATLPQPVLRKDFFIDDYQILEARAHGADAILLMANVLDATQLRDFHQLARELGMEALFEIHTLDEIATLPKSARVVGINSRKFKSTSGFVGSTGSSQKDFSLEMSVFDLVNHLPAGCLRVAESGLAPETIASVSSKFDAALVGTSLLRDPRGLEACLADFERAIEAHPHRHGN
ncbi:MAG: Indole-3-glycerol phosphate synthase [Verrucomicrobiota bacterium]